MHIVVIAWLFITFTMALTMRAVAGVLFFLVAGVLPVALIAALAVRRRRATRRSGEGTPTAPAPREPPR